MKAPHKKLLEARMFGKLQLCLPVCCCKWDTGLDPACLLLHAYKIFFLDKTKDCWEEKQDEEIVLLHAFSILIKTEEKEVLLLQNLQLSVYNVLPKM